MMLDIVSCQPREVAFVVLESALRQRVLDVGGWMELLARVSDRSRVLLSTASNLSGSGTESLFLLRSRALGISIRQQVQLGVDRVDFVLGDRLVVEIDSREFHERERDARRDARLGRLGYRILRFTYHQVMHDWPSVEAAVVAALIRSDHRA